jgi:hypothetical protein
MTVFTPTQATGSHFDRYLRPDSRMASQFVAAGLIGVMDRVGCTSRCGLRIQSMMISFEALESAPRDFRRVLHRKATGSSVSSHGRNNLRISQHCLAISAYISTRHIHTGFPDCRLRLLLRARNHLDLLHICLTVPLLEALTHPSEFVYTWNAVNAFRMHPRDDPRCRWANHPVFLQSSLDSATLLKTSTVSTSSAVP